MFYLPTHDVYIMCILSVFHSPNLHYFQFLQSIISSWERWTTVFLNRLLMLYYVVKWLLYFQFPLIIGFDEYFTSLRPLSNRRNPWFLEYWEVLHNCTWSNTDTIASHNRVVHRPPYRTVFPRRCTGNELRHLSFDDYHQLFQLQFVADALLAFAYALKDMHADLCGVETRGLCDRMRPVKGGLLKKYLSKVQFKGMTPIYLSSLLLLSSLFIRHFQEI